MQEYEAVLVTTFGGRRLPRFHLDNQREIARRLYFFDIVGRNPQLYEWQAGGFSPDGYLEVMKSQFRPRTVGFTVAFPHTATDCVWGDNIERESNLYKRNFRVGRNGADYAFEPIYATRDGDDELAGCPAELTVFDSEKEAWLIARSVYDYFYGKVADGLHAIEPQILRYSDKLETFFAPEAERQRQSLFFPDSI